MDETSFSIIDFSELLHKRQRYDDFDCFLADIRDAISLGNFLNPPEEAITDALDIENEQTKDALLQEIIEDHLQRVLLYRELMVRMWPHNSGLIESPSPLQGFSAEIRFLLQMGRFHLAGGSDWRREMRISLRDEAVYRRSCAPDEIFEMLQLIGREVLWIRSVVWHVNKVEFANVGWMVSLYFGTCCNYLTFDVLLEYSTLHTNKFLNLIYELLLEICYETFKMPGMVSPFLMYLPNESSHLPEISKIHLELNPEPNIDLLREQISKGLKDQDMANARSARGTDLGPARNIAMSVLNVKKCPFASAVRIYDPTISVMRESEAYVGREERDS
ncbi:uncharacterized protein RSE6_11725 [Rhynchosporium secalis]|uniref:Uncharacterized protein n=1 Tax=Rhynchosporium secalis TaxID=38038 RepID=A0A1E1MNM9_RHYSE|nr:uncharacterized protein RSE6_11725 [Rhynchosporium secalis]